MYHTCRFILGGWFKIDLIQVPLQYFQHFVCRLGFPIDSIRRVSHKRPPSYHQSSKRISYKGYDIQALRDCIHEQQLVQLKESALFSGIHEIQGQEKNMSIDDEIEAAMRCDPWNSNRDVEHRRPTLHTSIEVAEGEGRITREIEIVWWPDVFDCSGNGRLFLRYYLKKISL